MFDCRFSLTDGNATLSFDFGPMGSVGPLMNGPSFTSKGTKYFHQFNISLCGAEVCEDPASLNQDSRCLYCGGLSREKRTPPGMNRVDNKTAIYPQPFRWLQPRIPCPAAGEKYILVANVAAVVRGNRRQQAGPRQLNGSASLRSQSLDGTECG
ncbi:unnamed protein product [Boreogadus saida]